MRALGPTWWTIAASIACFFFHGACIFNDALPANAQIECTSSGDCPTGMLCAGLIERCVPDDGDATPPEANATVSTELLSASGSLDVTVTPNEALAVAPLIQVGAIERAALPAEGDESGGSFAARFDAGELGAGVHAVIAVLVDDSGNAGLVAVGAVTVDATAPSLDLDEPIRFTIEAPAGSLVAAPTRVVLGSRVTLAFEVSEPLAAPPVVTARGPADVQLVAAGEDEGAFVFSLEVTTPLGPGTYAIDALLEDVAGNSVVVAVPLPEPGFVVDEIVPSPCVFVAADGTPLCTDFDGDGFDGRSGSCAPAVGQLDCDDTDPLTNPGARELAGDGRDNDCLGDGDVALDDDSAIFVDPNLPAGASGDGTRASPFADLFAATDAANLALKTLAMRAGSFGVVPSGWVTQVDVVGGLDENFAMSDLAARTRIEFVDGRDTVFPGVTPHTYVALDLVSANNIIDASTEITLLRSRLEAGPDHGAVAAPAVVLVASEIVRGPMIVGDVRAYASTFGSLVAAGSGLVIRSRFADQVEARALGAGKLELVSSAIVGVDTDRGARVDGRLVLWASTVRTLSSDPGDIDGIGPALLLGTGEAHVVGSVVEGGRTIARDLATGGVLFATSAAVVATCAIETIEACVVDIDGVGCTGSAPCGSWQGVLDLQALEEVDGDPFLVAHPALVNAGAPLEPAGAPTATAGDLVGRCRDTSRPTLGANE